MLAMRSAVAALLLALVLPALADEAEDAVYDLKAVNPHKKPDVDDRTPEGLMDIIEAKGQEVAEALTALRNKAFEGVKA